MQSQTPPDPPVVISECADADITAVQSIYAHYVGTSLVTFETEAPSRMQMAARRGDVLRSGHPFLVARRGGGVIGYAYASPYRPRPAYHFTAENSVYVDPGHLGFGVGTALLRELIARCERQGLRQMVAVIGDSQNAASIRLHQKLGFAHAGTLRRVGHKFNQWVDTVLMQRQLGPESTQEPLSHDH